MDNGNAQDMVDIDMDSSRISNSIERENGRVPPSSRLTYRDMVL